MTTPQERFARLATVPMQTVSSGGKRAGSIAQLREIFRHREMLSLLIRRDLKSRYKDSVLGFTWTLVRPLTQLLIYYVVIGKFLQAQRGIPEFAIFVFSGLTIYGFFNEIIASSTASIVGNSGLIKKVYLPREVFPLASLGSAIFNFIIQFAILVAATLALVQFPVTPDIVYLLPSALLIAVLGFALGLLLSAANVYLRDTQYLVEVALLLLMWASPIVYAWRNVHDLLGDSFLLQVYTDNPITLAVLGFQRSMWVAGQGTPGFQPALYPDHLMLRIVVALAVSVVLVFVFQRVFARVQGNFAQEV